MCSVANHVRGRDMHHPCITCSMAVMHTPKLYATEHVHGKLLNFTCSKHAGTHAYQHACVKFKYVELYGSLLFALQISIHMVYVHGNNTALVKSLMASTLIIMFIWMQPFVCYTETK